MVTAALNPDFADAFVQGVGVGLLVWLAALVGSLGVRLLRRVLAT